MATLYQTRQNACRRSNIIDLAQYRADMGLLSGEFGTPSATRRRRRKHHGGVYLSDLLSLCAVGMTLAVTGIILAGL